MASLEDISLLNPDNITVTKEHLKTCCKPVYHPRRFKSKGALLILVWNFLCMSVFYLLSHHLNKTYASKAWFGTLGITMLIAGLLADTRIGRYKVVCSYQYLDDVDCSGDSNDKLHFSIFQSKLSWH